MGFGDGAQRSEECLPGLGERQFVVAAIAFGARALDECALFEGVEQRHDPARGGAEPGGEFALADPRAAAEHADGAGVARGESEFGDALGEAVGRIRPQLREQERGARRRGSRMRGCGLIGHVTRIQPCRNNYSV